MRQLIGSILLIISLVNVSCHSKLNLENIIDQKSPFTLTTLDAETNHFEKEKLEVNSEKHKKLINFIMHNEKDWKISKASYRNNINVTQNNFRLNYIKGSDWVVIGFTDNDNNPKQYSKNIKKGELDFLGE